MKVCFIGLGSIARRHIHNLKVLLGNAVEIDVLRSGKGNVLSPEDGAAITRVCTSEDALQGKYDAVFITNPTALHYQTLQRFHDRSDFFFIEKPVFERGDEALDVFWGDGKTYYVACPLRYTNVIQYLKKNIDFSEVYAMRCISSSYLPAWRPGTDYRQTYSAHKNMGGGVSIDLIHEWDYIHYLIGKPQTVHSIIRKKSNLEIDSDDIAVYIAEYPDMLVELHLDYFGKAALRRVELFTKEDTIAADLIDQKITFLSAGEVIDLSQERNEFQKRELQHFIDIVNGKTASDNSLQEACHILKIARGQ